MSPARQGDQSCYAPGPRVVDETGPYSTNHGANRIHSRFRRVSGTDGGPRSSEIERYASRVLERVINKDESLAKQFL